MPALSLRTWKPAWRRHDIWWIAAAVVAALAVGTGMLHQRQAEQEARAWWLARTQAARQIDLQTCTEGALMVHDVRWAASCMQLNLQDGHAECELPDARAAALYAMLHNAEQRCLAEARQP